MLELNKLAQTISEKLKTLFSENTPHIGERSEKGAQYSLKIAEVRFERGISCRKSCTACFDVLYCGEAGGIAFEDWSEMMSREFDVIYVDDQLLHTSKRCSREEDGVFHFTFEVKTDYIEYALGETMQNLEVTDFKKK